MSQKFLEKIKKIEKSYFTFKDLEKLWEGKRESLKVVLSRLKKKGKIKKVKREIYFLPEKIVQVEKIANQVYFPSYLSFESALSLWGILSQIPYVLTFATCLKTKKIKIGKVLVEYRKVKKDLFFGFVFKNGIYIALPEKALLDILYLKSLGKMKIDFSSLDFSKIKKTKFLKWLKKFPYKTKKLAKDFIPLLKL